MSFFTLGAKDFDEAYRGYNAYNDQVEKMNRKRAAELMQNRKVKPKPIMNPQGDMPAVYTPPGPTQQELNAQAAARANAAKAKTAQAQPTQTVRSSDPDSFAGQGLQLVGFDPNSNIDNRGLAIRNNPNLSQFQKDVGGVFNKERFDNRLKSIRYGLSSGNVRGVDTGPATGIFGQIKGYFTDTDEEAAARQAQGVITDWYDSDEAEQYFMQNPIELERAINDPIGVYRRLKETATPLAAPAQTTQPTTQAGVSTTRNGVPVVSMDIPQAAPQVAGVVPGSDTITRSGGRRKSSVEPIAGLATGESNVVKKAMATAKPKEPKRITSMALVNKELSEAVAGYDQLYEMAELYNAAGDSEAYFKARLAVDRMGATLTHLANQKAVNLLEKNGDPRMLSAIRSQVSGEDYVIRPQTGGGYAIEINGQVVESGVSAASIVSRARSSMSTAYNTAVNQAQAARVTARDDARYKIMELVLGKQWDGFNELNKQKFIAESKITDIDGEIYVIRNGQLVGKTTREQANISGDGTTTVIDRIYESRSPSRGLLTSQAPDVNSIFAAFRS